MQSIMNIRKLGLKPIFSTRAVTTTSRYTKVYKATPTIVKKVEAEQEPKTSGDQAEAEKQLGAPLADFPVNPQFDTRQTDTTSEESGGQNWSTSFYGLSTEKFPDRVADILLEPIKAEDIEIKPDGLLYLPEIKYRRILNKAFGPGGWGLAPRGEHTIAVKNISREYALVCGGRFVSQARGEQDFFDPSNLPTAAEGCKSNALMRCCKDLGIASELWDPVFIRKYKKKYCTEVWGEHVTTKKKKKLWRKKDDTLDYPYKET
ncbi:mitochondrial genome maintenance MGM101-domain-containing protein [Sporodiniella umbellata]|nr:mitochondrial genome maintenance MGM101-domain-containing protein [Sporodiniella umbellata]